MNVNSGEVYVVYEEDFHFVLGGWSALGLA